MTLEELVWDGRRRCSKRQKKAQLVKLITTGIPVAVCHATSSCMWSLDIYRCLLNLAPALAQDWCGFGCRFRRRTTIWSWNFDIPSVLPRCFLRGDVCSFSGLTYQKGQAPAARISLTRGVRETRWLLGSSAHGNKTRYYVIGTIPGNETRETLVSDAAVHVRRWLSLTHCMEKRHNTIVRALY